MERLVLEHLHLVGPIAHKVSRLLPYTLDIEDLEAQGRLGLVQAARSFARGRGVSFGVWAYFGIRHAILNANRGKNYVWEAMRIGVQGQDTRLSPEPGADVGLLHRERLALFEAASRVALSRKERATLDRVARGWRMAAIGRQLHVTETGACSIRDRAIRKVQGYLRSR